ncbi:MAG TPA: sporangiospore maturation cell wall hydrolase GsmA [Micromonosporaceae bacterium]|jgi:flagellar protein FlgJ|nr:sporangiospore maturation cell wall hydrolase GsmA [Micromonosporaceae bacterium]
MHPRLQLPILLLSMLASVVGAGAVAEPAYAAGYGATARTGGGPLNVRSGASTSHARVATIPDGRRITLSCQVTGQKIRGAVRTTAAWDRLPDGRYVSDAYVSRRVSVARCPAPGPGGDPNAAVDKAGFLRRTAAPAQRGMREYGVPASVTMAQAILESGWGRSGLASNDNNYFGIKCFGDPGPIAIGCHSYRTTECDSTGCHPEYADFRVYRTVSDSFADHGRFLRANRRYANAFRYSKDPDRFAAEIHKAGYATSPTYTKSLVGLMKQYDLYRYDT